MDKISLRQIISSLSKGGDWPVDWLSMEEIKSSITSLKEGTKRFTGGNFIAYPIVENDELVNILYCRSSSDAIMLLKLLQEGDE